MIKKKIVIDLDKLYGELNIKELVEVIESIEKYKPEVIEFCEKRVKKMKIKKAILKSYAIEIIKTRFYEYFTSGDYLSNEPILLNSYYLTEKEVKASFKEAKADYINYIDGATRSLPC